MSERGYTPKDVARFWSKVDRSGGDNACWLWTAGLNRTDGYGRICLIGKRRQAHRVSWEIANGQIPTGQKVLHKCDNPKCVNPKHLFVGTMKDNVQDMITKGRANRLSGKDHWRHKTPERAATGERHGEAKLTTEKVRTIHRRYAQGGVSQRQLAGEFNVSQRAIWNILSGKTWREVHDE